MATGSNDKDAPMNLTRPLRIFLLYARSDEKAVRRLYSRLSKVGASVWMDRKKLLPGQDWQSEIRQAIYSSDIIIVCLSKQFNKQGGYRHEEVRIALEKASGLPDNMLLIIPVRLEECDMPEPLHRWQRVDLFETNRFRALLSALKQHVAQR
jgi:hypothetical protein